jgi:hypothetical protein
VLQQSVPPQKEKKKRVVPISAFKVMPLEVMPNSIVGEWRGEEALSVLKNIL